MKFETSIPLHLSVIELGIYVAPMHVIGIPHLYTPVDDKVLDIFDAQH